jgi:outer membrane lipoprotein-sorting protein
MNNKLFSVIITLLFLLPVQGFAQKDAKAREWLDKSSAAFGKAGAFTVNFTMNVRNASTKASESFDGILDLKGNKIHLNTPENEIWFDGKTQWLLQKDFDEVQISEPTAQEVQALNPTVILSVYKKDCNYKYLGEKTDDKKRKVHEVEIIPQAKNSEMKRIVMQISATDNMPLRIQVFYKNKMENIIHINKYQKNTTLTDSSFVFNAKNYPKAEIIDLR